MAIHEIILAIDEYLDQLKAARKLLVAYSKSSVYLRRKPIGEPIRKKSRAALRPDDASIASPPIPVSIQVIPPKRPRERHVTKKSSSALATAVAKSIPQGLVIVRPNEMTQQHLATSAREPRAEDTQKRSASSPLNELAQEVRRRMAANFK